MLAKNLLALLNLNPTTTDFEDFKLKGLSIDSRNISKDYCFIAIDGSDTDGHNFIKAAVEKGARLIIHDKKHSAYVSNLNLPGNPALVAVDNTRAIVGRLAAEFFDNPAKKLQMTGITGTNGKTTVSFLIEHIFLTNSIKTGVLGTIHYKIADHVQKAKNTTPDAITIQHLLQHMLGHGLTHGVMEVSSHALDQYRVEGIDFKNAVFTNLTHDHLDYHFDRENYFKAKAKLFENLSEKGSAVINIDDEYGLRLKEITKAQIMDYAIENKSAKVRAKDIILGLDATEFTLLLPQAELRIKTSFLGRHNIYNILAAISVGIIEKIPLELISNSLKTARCVPGRLEKIKNNLGFQVFVDYAHTDDALKNVLTTLRELNPKKIIIVFGCGGNRDKKKRPLMGKLASRLADFLVLTNDNPRNEEPEDIARDIISGFNPGFRNYEVVLDRKQAIHQAMAKAQSGDFVLIAGKGHETDQIFKDKTIDFDDRKIAKEILDSL